MDSANYHCVDFLKIVILKHSFSFYVTKLFFCATVFAVRSQRSCSPTNHRWMNRMKATSTFLQPSPRPSAARTSPTRASTTLPPRSMGPAPAALAWSERTWMTSRRDPMGQTASTASKPTVGDLSMCERIHRHTAEVWCG